MIREHTSTDKIINLAIQAQEKIGIRRVPLGHLSSRWNLVQEEYIRSLSPKGPEDGSQWALLATKHILKVKKAVWKFRNTILHANTIILQSNDSINLNNIQQIKGTLQQRPQGPDNILTMIDIHSVSHQHSLHLNLWKKTYDKAVQVS